MPILSGSRNTPFSSHTSETLPKNICLVLIIMSIVLKSYVLNPIAHTSKAHTQKVAVTRHVNASSSTSRRSFPPSFWDSNYPSPPSRLHCDPTGAPTYAMDPYAQVLHPGLPHTHAHPHPSESWSYSQSQPYPPPRPLHELYTPPGLDAHFGPLLMPAVRPPHLPTLSGHYDVGKLEPTPTWPGLLPPGEVAQSLKDPYTYNPRDVSQDL
uniref:Uncharacterized protein n=1 Tax=Sinocyclocheilus grahami TaxID=75366 RepID=A0A672PVC4_SINGR